MIQQLASEAARLVRAKQFSTLPSAVGHVLDERNIRGGRVETMRKVLSELGKRGALTRGHRAGHETLAHSQQVREEDQQNALDQMREDAMLQDAIAREKNEHLVPRSAWDPNHPENSP